MTLYCNGMGADALREIERSTGVCHNTVINWVRDATSRLPDENYEIPETAQLDELQTFVGSKKAARPRVAVRRKGMLAKTTKFGAAAIAASDASRVFERKLVRQQ